VTMDDPPSVVVVGAGASGCLVAARLAATGRRVTLVEAGPDLRGREPAGFRDGWDFSRDHAWGYTSEPGPSGEPTSVLRTRAVGGTAWVTRFALRPHPGDLDDWAALGATGWDRATVGRAFAAVEHDLDHGDDAWHGTGGPIAVTRYPDVEPTEFESAVRVAAQESGLTAVLDLNRPEVAGFGRMPMSSEDGRRSLTVDLLVDAPPNLRLHSDAQVAEVGIEGRRVTAVRLVDGSELRADTVVLAAGVYGSPCLLMRSGVGPAGLLTGLGITVRADLPGVGENLCDHPAVSVDSGYRGVQRPGPVLHTLATFASEPGARDDPRPDLALWVGDPEGDPAEGWLDVLLWRPEARGRVRLASADPTASPRIWLPVPTEADVQTLVHGVRRTLELLDSPAMRSIGAGPPEDVPADPVQLAAWVASECYSLPHTVGTCAMGASPQRGAVVDGTGRVHDLDGLYVVDASVMPGPPTGFPHLVTLMLAERLAGVIAHRER
jgi:choline dehydrogenase-like flavoprotein